MNSPERQADRVSRMLNLSFQFSANLDRLLECRCEHSFAHGLYGQRRNRFAHSAMDDRITKDSFGRSRHPTGQTSRTIADSNWSRAQTIGGVNQSHRAAADPWPQTRSFKPDCRIEVRLDCGGGLLADLTSTAFGDAYSRLSESSCFPSSATPRRGTNPVFHSGRRCCFGYHGAERARRARFWRYSPADKLAHPAS